MFMTLISGLMAGPAVSLSGSPTVSPVTLALCISEPLPVSAVLRLVLDHLLGVVPGAAGVGHEHGQQLARPRSCPPGSRPGRTAPAGSRPAIGVKMASRPGPISSFWAVLVQMSTTRP